MNATRIHDRLMTLDELFWDRVVVSTPEAAEFAGITENEAREWAAANSVDRAGFSFAWSQENVEDLAAEFDEDEDDDGTEVFAENPIDGDDDDDEDDDDIDDDDEDEHDDIDDHDEENEYDDAG